MTTKPMPNPRKRLSLPGVEEFSTQLRTMFINIGFFAATILLLPAVGAQLTRNAVIIEPIAVPSALAKQGLAPEVVANRIWDGLQDFAQSAAAARGTVVAIPDSQLVEFSLPDAGISIDSIFTQIRQFFGVYDTRLTGEMLCATSACERGGLRLRLRIVRNDFSIVDLPEMGATAERDYYRDAAAGIYEIIDPYVAIAAQAESKPLHAATLARRIIADDTKDAKWAHNLVADIELKAGELDRAADDYRAALALDQNFHIARAGLARALGDAGDADAAREIIADLEKRDPTNKLALPILADLAYREKNVDEAIALLRRATERDPLNAAHLRRAGDIAFEADRRDEALALFREAIAIEPGLDGAMSRAAFILMAAEDFAGAEEIYRDYLGYVPDDVSTLQALGNLQFANKRYDLALATFDQVLAVSPGDLQTQLYRGASLMSLSRFADAATQLEAVTEGLPNDEVAFRLLGSAYKRSGRPVEAIAAYERQLEINSQGPNARSSRQYIEELKAQLAGTSPPPSP